MSWKSSAIAIKWILTFIRRPLWIWNGAARGGFLRFYIIHSHFLCFGSSEEQCTYTLLLWCHKCLESLHLEHKALSILGSVKDWCKNIFTTISLSSQYVVKDVIYRIYSISIYLLLRIWGRWDIGPNHVLHTYKSIVNKSKL